MVRLTNERLMRKLRRREARHRQHLPKHQGSTDWLDTLDGYIHRLIGQHLSGADADIRELDQAMSVRVALASFDEGVTRSRTILLGTLAGELQHELADSLLVQALAENRPELLH